LRLRLTGFRGKTISSVGKRFDLLADKKRRID
jgi:hypothetical protein